MEEFKSFDTLLEPDQRWKSFATLDTTTNLPKSYAIEDMYTSIEKIKLNNSVPDDVKSQFNVAKMLGVYAWLYYPFHQIAELKAFSTLEMGLRTRFPHIKNFSRLLSHAVENGFIRDSGFSNVEQNPNDSISYSKKLPKLIPSIRNDLAHGTITLHPGSLFTINNCAEILNQLFPTSNPPKI
jgi:hypothetical protein